MSLNNKQCKTRPFLIDLNHVELKYYLFMVILGKCNRSCNSVNELSTKTCVLNKTKNVNVKVFNIITKINKAKTLVKHISCESKCKFDSIKCQILFQYIVMIKK